MGQTLPGLTPRRFGPAEIQATQSWFWHSSPGFSPDGMQMYWAKYVPPSGMRLAYSVSTTDGWSVPETPPFAGEGLENQPRFSVDGTSLYYVAERSAGHILRVTRSGTGWSEPQALGLTFPSGMAKGWQFSVAADGSVYLDADVRQGSNLDLFRFPRTGGGYGPPVPLSVNTPYHEFAPFVAPDESYLIFVSNRPGGFGLSDLWIAFRRTDGSWTDPLNMGPAINTPGEDGSPAVTLDGLYLFYTTQRAGDAGYSPYWVSAQVIQPLRSQALGILPATSVPFERGPQQWGDMGTWQAVLADLDADGDPDVALANMSGPSRVLLNDGHGGLQDAGASLQGGVHGAAVGDIDGDGDPDLVFVSNSADTPPSPVYLNQGQGRFQRSPLSLDEGGFGGVGIWLSDVDGDGDPDALVHYLRSIRATAVLRNDGTGRFVREQATYPVYSDFGDVNGDGFVDMVSPGANDALDILLNDRTGRWSLASTLPAAGRGYEAGGIFVDVEQDGDLDFLFPAFGSGVHLVLNDGTGRFSESGQVLTSNLMSRICAGDLNGDGYADLVIGERGGPMQIWLNDRSGRFTDTGSRLATGVELYSCVVRDLDGDGDLDLFVSAFAPGSNQVWFNRLIERGGR